MELQGLKPWTSAMPWQRSNQLSYSPILHNLSMVSHCPYHQLIRALRFFALKALQLSYSPKHHNYTKYRPCSPEAIRSAVARPPGAQFLFTDVCIYANGSPLRTSLVSVCHRHTKNTSDMLSSVLVFYLEVCLTGDVQEHVHAKL